LPDAALTKSVEGNPAVPVNPAVEVENGKRGLPIQFENFPVLSLSPEFREHLTFKGNLMAAKGKHHFQMRRCETIDGKIGAGKGEQVKFQQSNLEFWSGIDHLAIDDVDFIDLELPDRPPFFLFFQKVFIKNNPGVMNKEVNGFNFRKEGEKGNLQAHFLERNKIFILDGELMDVFNVNGQRKDPQTQIPEFDLLGKFFIDFFVNVVFQGIVSAPQE
jgi:hypothetical protein